jgi:phospho-N-acetylmuramoyl-pentapeptide-transferase
MFFYLAQYLETFWSGFHAFTYVTLRSILAMLTALFIGLVFGPSFIRKLIALKVGQAVRDDGPQTHLLKTGTPTMGGMLILLSISIAVVLWADLKNSYVWLLLFVLLSTGLVGLIDDWRKVVARNPKGLSARAKMLWQSLIAVVCALFLIYSAQLPASTTLIVPFFKNIAYPFGTIGFCILAYLAIVGTSNAVNLTDGLDGLVAMPVVLVAMGMAIFAYITGHIVFAKYIGFPFISGAHEVVVFCSAMAGACLAFLWFNAHPAQMFMGDVGALSLGAVLGTIAVIIRQEIVLVIMGGLFVAEALSVMLQVASFKLTGKRMFRMAPLHHHFELKGWKETQVVVRFWIITMLLVLLGLSTIKLR